MNRDNHSFKTTKIFKMKFQQYIQPDFANDMIVLVQPLNDHEIVIFDRKGRGEIWKRTNHELMFRKESNLSVMDQSCMHRVVSYTDKKGTRMILSCTDSSEELYVYNQAEDHRWEFPIKIGSKFNLIQSNDKVYMVTKEEEEEEDVDKVFELHIVWNNWRDVLFEKTEVPSSDEINEKYKVQSVSDYTWHRTHDLSDSNFDLSSIPSEHTSIISKCYSPKGSTSSKGKIIVEELGEYNYYKSLRTIYCYCWLGSSLICGHDGFVSIWS